MCDNIIDSSEIALDDIRIKGFYSKYGEEFTIKYKNGDVPMVKIKEFKFNGYASVKNNHDNIKCIYLDGIYEFGSEISDFHFELKEITCHYSCKYVSRDHLLKKKFKCKSLIKKKGINKDQIVFHFKQNKNGEITSMIKKDGKIFLDEIVEENIENESKISLILKPFFQIDDENIIMILLIEEMNITTTPGGKTPIDIYANRFSIANDQNIFDLKNVQLPLRKLAFNLKAILRTSSKFPFMKNEINKVGEILEKLSKEHDFINDKIKSSKCELHWLVDKLNDTFSKLQK